VFYFPAALVALRTLKGEHLLGLPEGLEEKLQEQDPDWLVNGRRGVIQASLPA
ncbi:MAG: protein-glutamate O-methyltransferase family protein, partial [Caldilineae bacterium]